MIDRRTFVPPKIFISHSARDARLAEQLVDLIRAAFNFSSKHIRCTSVDGTRLPGGAYTDEQVRREVAEATLLIGLISQNAISSAYVLFELGARWGAAKPLIPVLAPGSTPSMLAGPLAGISALRANNAGELLQLVDDIAHVLEISPEPASAYRKRVDAIVTDRGQLLATRSQKFWDDDNLSGSAAASVQKVRVAPRPTMVHASIESRIRNSHNRFLHLSSLVSCPVYMAPATTETNRIRLNLLNEHTGYRLTRQLSDFKTGEFVEPDGVIKGYEYERGRYVTVTDDELEALQVPFSKVIELDHLRGSRSCGPDLSRHSLLLVPRRRDGR
jgi:hypothetical protein